LCGENREVSNVPSWRCVTGMPIGESSEESTDVKEERAETMLDSGAWNGGERLEMMEGVRTRTDGLDGAAEGECCCGLPEEAKRGRKDCRVNIGVSKRVFKRSLNADGERVAMGAEG
jgi:hypothetical protein